MSLKDQLKKEILSDGKITYDRLGDICEQGNYRQSNGERRMRELCAAKFAKPVEKDGYIIGWQRKESEMLKKFEGIPAFKFKVEEKGLFTK